MLGASKTIERTGQPHSLETIKMKSSTLPLLVCIALAPVALPAEKLPGPLLDGLGDLHHPVTTNSKQAQRYFDQGMRLLFCFNHKEAIRSFRSAAHLDPNCAMAYWGTAYAFGPHVNKPMDTNDTVEAWAALQLAVAAKSKGSAKDQAYITALEKRYQPERIDPNVLGRDGAGAANDDCHGAGYPARDQSAIERANAQDQQRPQCQHGENQQPGEIVGAVREHDLRREIIGPAGYKIFYREIGCYRTQRQSIAAPRYDVIRGTDATDRGAGCDNLQGDRQRK